MTHDSSAPVRVTTNEHPSPNKLSPQLSLVVPCYNVDTYLPVLLRSLDRQDCDASQIELIFVIDGSPDDSERTIADWMPRSQFSVSLIVQENRGVSGALNTGLERARGEWVSFSGPDDELSPNYFSEILAGAKDPAVSMLVTRLVRISASGGLSSHPLDYKFTGVSKNTTVQLDEQPEMIQLHAGMTAFRRSIILESGLRFDERLRQGFEDAHFIARYLLRLDRPSYTILPQAYYYYLARESSITAQTDYSKYITLCDVAYTGLLNEAGDSCPAWLGSLILYDLWWLFRQYANMKSSVFGLSPEQQQQLNTATRSVLQRVGVDNIRSFRVVNTPLDTRAAWEAAAQPNGESHVAIRRDYDSNRQLLKIVFHSTDPNAQASIGAGKKQFPIAFRHARAVLYFERTWIYEHIYWVHINDAITDLDSLRISGESPELDFMFAGQVLEPRPAGRLLKKVPPGLPKVIPPAPESASTAPQLSSTRQTIARERRLRLSYSLAYRVGGLIGWRKQFADAWVLIDRNTQANDNAEALYRYLRNARPDINAWFVIDKGTSDWTRLKADGFRLVAHGSKKHFALMKEAKVLSSSMIDQYIVQPFPKRFLPKTWSYSFLQHGVTKDLLHRWWNSKTIDHFVTSTLPEHHSIAGSPSPYKLSEREVTLTGMPRHDRLFRLMQDAPTRPPGTHRIVLMPTWRNYLLGANTGAERDQLDSFAESQFVSEWSGFLNGPYLSELSQRPGVEVILLPHPGIDAHWKDLLVPPSIRRVSYVGDDVQEILAGATLVVTDYSSQAFEGAFCEAPSVYFQFDRAEFFSGGHIGSAGYFDYFRDGFGPVCEDRATLEQNLEEMILGTHPELSEYSRRIERLYPLRDGKSSERIVGEIESRLRSYSG